MSNTQKKNVPELRFPGFEGEWEDVKFVSIFQEVSNKTSDLAKYPLFSLTVEKGITPKTERYKRDFLVKKSDNFKIVEPRDIVYNPMNVTLGAIDLSKYNYDIALSGYYHVMKIINSFNPDFISNFLKTEKMIIHYKKIATGSLMEKQRVHFSEFKNIIKKFPTNKEQQKIGDFFSKLDRQIELEEQKLELLQQQKKGYMQKIFSQELRFKDENGEDYPDWEKKKLGEFAGKVIQKNTDKKYTETLTNSAELGIISQRDFFDKEISNIDNIKNYYVVEENDFVYNPRISTYAPFGPVNRNKLGKKGVMSPLYTVFRIQSSDLNFIEFYFKSSKWYRFMALNGDSGARADRFSIKDKTLMEMPLYIPCMDEQIKIGQFFNNIDKCIKNYQSKISLLKKNKKSFLQKMFI
ncbi:TPA: restriction endonuclease subunit S [Staphylococcus aureus]|uniref:restriction endonuclease subunit S n=5 Tax=Staphylococcus aureus TaxID=1280 RepID=UPI0013EF6C4F|nr:restriction endonuclease subunit S [Staphylococcus aureus]ELG8226878.1 restriction endonuclease subunit S [Staphylococcus aureus]UVJ36692.1 restriction endonuclease subunit S [Staphylococcus aureus]HBC4906626.1 restriction endonuclease subunit S [Staphylococcus aureus]HCG2453340.1 restriction endonuclease subunit S [Staphylococcus aureus]HCG2683084.1 restriction endonuclease subunit S [Staphylococcus aureus]